MKVLLINPPQSTKIMDVPSVLGKIRGAKQPLGLLYLASYLCKYTDYSVEVIDAQIEKKFYKKLSENIKENTPNVIGVTTMTFNLIDVLKVVNAVKNIDMGIKVVLGGPHVELFPNETIELKGVDYLVLGDGEVVFKELLDRLDDYEALKEIPGLVFKAKNKIINTGKYVMRNLDELPFPARNLLPIERYTSLLAKYNPITTIFTSRGCPYRCSFCNASGVRYRMRSPGNVVDELERCVRMGISGFLFYDDVFCVNRQRVINICNEIVRRKLAISWNIHARVDNVDAQMLKKLKMAGCQTIYFGVEAGTDKILHVLNKGITLKQVRDVFKMVHKNKISTLAYFIMGNPNETKSDICSTVSLMEELNPDYVQVNALVLMPGTDLYYKAMGLGILEKDLWREFSRNPTSDFIAPRWDRSFSRQELNELVIEAYKRFYLKSLVLFRRMIKIQSMSEFIKYVRFARDFLYKQVCFLKR